MSELIRHFALALVQSDNSNGTPLESFGHNGVACGRREETDEKWQFRGVEVYYAAI